MYFCEDILSMTYQELITERDWLKKRVRELEEENLKLKEILGYIVPAKQQEPSVLQPLSLQEKVDLFRSLFKGREDVVWQGYSKSITFQ